MRYKTLFRILCKAMGVYFTVYAVVGIVGGAASVIATAKRFAGMGSTYTGAQWWDLLHLAGPGMELLIGLYLFFGGRRLADWAIPGNRPYCPECGYDLTAAVSDVCPECGTHPQRGRKEEPEAAADVRAQQL